MLYPPDISIPFGIIKSNEISLCIQKKSPVTANCSDWALPDSINNDYSSSSLLDFLLSFNPRPPIPSEETAAPRRPNTLTGSPVLGDFLEVVVLFFFVVVVVLFLSLIHI